MAVIAMTREMGSLGKDVAAGLADQLRLKVVHHELIAHELAERLGVQESAVHRYLEGSASLFERWKIDKQKLSRYTAQEIIEFARGGNVIIRGWGATALLRHIPHVLLVRVCAPMAFRQRVMMQRMGLKDASIARREIERNDAAHARIMQEFFGVDWENPLLYHVVLNTESTPIETCVQVVRLLAESPAFQETEATRSVLADKLLESCVRDALSHRLGIELVISPIEVTAANGKVTLMGTTMRNQLSADVEQLVRGIAGVNEIENRIAVKRTHCLSVVPTEVLADRGQHNGRNRQSRSKRGS